MRTWRLTGRLSSLTREQLRVLQILCQGLLNKQIAYHLDVGETTVKAHVGEILRKLSVGSRTQAVLETSRLDFGAVLAPAQFEREVRRRVPALLNTLASGDWRDAITRVPQIRARARERECSDRRRENAAQDRHDDVGHENAG